MTVPADWLVPDWEVPANVRAVCSTRAGGFSRGAYESLNLGDHVGDEPQRVAQNRAAFAQALDARPVYMQQVHGTQVAALDADSRDGLTADACVTRQTGVACTIMVADCLPLLFASRDGAVVGAAHAGWRGLSAGVVEAAANAIASGAGGDTGALLVWLGPCIGPDAFEVGGEVKAAFEATDAAAAKHFRAHREGKWLADLAALARMRLQALRITRVWGNDSSSAWCTASNPSRFFSHRRDGVSGRFAAGVWRT